MQKTWITNVYAIFSRLLPFNHVSFPVSSIILPPTLIWPFAVVLPSFLALKCLFNSHCFFSSCITLWFPPIMSLWPQLTFPSWLMPNILPSLPCPLLLAITSFTTSTFDHSLSFVLLLSLVSLLCFELFLICSYFYSYLSLLITVLSAPLFLLSSAHGGLPPTPTAGVPCPPQARHGYCGQANQAVGQLLWGGNPKDGCLSLWGGH